MSITVNGRQTLLDSGRLNVRATFGPSVILSDSDGRVIPLSENGTASMISPGGAYYLEDVNSLSAGPSSAMRASHMASSAGPPMAGGSMSGSQANFGSSSAITMPAGGGDFAAASRYRPAPVQTGSFSQMDSLPRSPMAMHASMGAPALSASSPMSFSLPPPSFSSNALQASDLATSHSPTSPRDPFHSVVEDHLQENLTAAAEERFRLEKELKSVSMAAHEKEAEIHALELEMQDHNHPQAVNNACRQVHGESRHTLFKAPKDVHNTLVEETFAMDNQAAALKRKLGRICLEWHRLEEKKRHLQSLLERHKNSHAAEERVLHMRAGARLASSPMTSPTGHYR